ncbi:MAG TPA: hypothetical protein VKQ54_14895 [Caulobacteraceae bacterium]|nr:hypothetical protein [Caulobacteraceae bacterium]
MTRLITGLAAAVLFASSVSGAARGAAVDPASYGGLHWRSIGPFRGGRVLAVAGAPDDPLHFYFGAVNGGVWETRDAGRTWSPISDSLPVGSIGALAVAPSAPRTLYVGTGEADMRSDIAQGLGLFKSVDGGKTWTASGLADSQSIAKILVDPTNPDVVLVAALGHPYGPNDQRGVFRSTDGGRTWTRTLFRNADTGAIDLVYKPGDPRTVYAALWQTRRPPWNVYPPSSGPGGGVFKSSDGGLTWTEIVGHGLPDAAGRIGLATAEAAPDRLYALIDARDAGGLYRSDDAGATWTKTTGDPRIRERGWYFGQLTVNPKNADQLWVLDTIVLRSDDGGRSFLPIKGDPTGDDFHVLWIDPADPNRRILGVDQGALVTLNGGATWSSWFNQPTGQFYHVATDNRIPYRVYGAQQDSGAADVPSRTGAVWDGIDITHFHELTPGGESDNIAPDPADPDTIYGGRVDRLDLRTGQVRDVDPTLAFPDRYRVTWTLPLAFGRDGKSLYFSNQRIFRTRDGGQHWTPISPDLTRPDPGVPANLDTAAAADFEAPGPRRGVVYSLGPSPLADDDLWAGTDDGLVWRTTDGGARWSDVTPAGLKPWSKVAGVEPSHFDRQTAYVAVDRHRLDDFTPYVWRTRDGGRSWTAIAAGLADGGVLNTVNVVREDPKRAGLLFAGTERGVFVSFNDGARWSSLQNGLPITSVRDITIHGDDLVIATHGRGFWILDDIASLRELAASPGAGPRLFAPAVAFRERPSGFTGTPMPKDEAMAANPPFGADIDYLLKSEARGPLVIEVRDAEGALVRRYSSADRAPPPDLAHLPIAPEWLPERATPSARAGGHRLVWDLRYATPPGLEGDFRIGGVWAPPGDYTVTLAVDGVRFSQPLRLAPDARVTAAPQSYGEAFRLARAIEADRVRVHDALAEIAKIKAGGAGSAAQRAQVTALASPLGLDSLPDLAERLGKLQRAVDGADGGPSPDARAGYAAASKSLAAALAAWSALKAEIAAATSPG